MTGIHKPFRIAVLVFWSGTLLAPGAHGAARVWEESLTIPTYELGPPDPNPALFDQLRRGRPVYPYPVLDTLTRLRVDKSYRAVFLENEYLKVTVLPELGGKLYAIFDKTANRDVLYTNHVVKYGIVGIRGAWTSGGIEWNFPDGHTVTTVSPVDYTTRMEPDGSAACTVGDTERIQRMQWAVTIRLRPGWKVVETEVTLNNRREVPGRYWFWATAAAPAAPDLRFVYPMREAYPHAFWPVFGFPLEKGVDLGTYREVPNALSLFARNSYRDFLGIYYETSDWGIVHVADHREVAGKKTWTWGTDDAGQIWVDKLTDADGQYVEFQAGRFETQMEHEFLAPHRVERFSQHWFPVNRLGGPFDEANRNGALRLERDGSRVRIAVNANARFDGALLTVEINGRQIEARTVDLSPGEPYVATVDVLQDAASKPVAVRIARNDGTELLGYRTDLPVDGNPEFRPATRPPPDTSVPASAEQAYVAGLAADKKSDEPGARAAYRQALDRDPGFAPAHTMLGLSYYRTGEYEKAAVHLAAALRRNRDAGDARYYLGLVRRAQGRIHEARRELLWAIRAGHREPLARYVLGEMALASGSLDEALEQLSEAVRLDPRDLKARTVLGMAFRLAGRHAEAQEHIDAVVRQVPIDYLGLHEQSEIYKARGKDVEAGRVRDELWRLLGREPDSLLELAFDYAAAGRSSDACSLLEQAISHRGNPQPLLHYALGYFYERRGERARAAAQYEAGRNGNPAYVFPHRVEEVAVLQAARAANPRDGRAAYYLGSALASLDRRAEALAAWRDAVRLDPANAVAHRNYGAALWSMAGRAEEALTAYERALQAAPDDFHLYVETDRLLASMRANDRRIRLLTGAPDSVRSTPAVVQALAGAHVDAGRFAEAAGLLESTEFTSGEGETSALAIFRKAHIGLAQQYRNAGQHERAAAALLKATEYPRNLGVGRSSQELHSRELVAAAREMEAAGKRSEAEALWRRAAAEPEGSPSEPNNRITEQHYYKALALERTGRKQQARALYTKLAALKDEPEPAGQATNLVLAGLGLRGLGQKDQARNAFERGLKLEPANELAAAALKDLTK
jgi:tetratricopeptide (TPR) repeat protein